MNFLLYIALRGAAALLTVLPVELMYRIAAWIGTVAFFLNAPPRRALIRNLAAALGKPPNSVTVRRAARRAFQCDAKNWVDTIRISRLDQNALQQLVDIDGLEHLDRACAAGRGAVLVGMHLGNFDLVGQVLALRGYRVTVPVEHMRPERLFAFIMKMRTSRGIHAVPIDRAPREMLRALRAGEMVAVVADRYIAGRATSVSFFGHQALLPVAASTLVKRSGAPLFVGVGVRKANNRFHGHIIPVPDLESSRERELSDQEIMQRITGVMESMVQLYPDQWLVFSPVFQDDVSPETVATMEKSETDNGAMTGVSR